MQRAMVFIDYENFEIARRKLYKKQQTQLPRLDLVLLPKRIIESIPLEMNLVKTFLFAPRPEGILAQDEHRMNTYNYLKGLENTNFFTVISGRHCARPTDKDFNSIDLRDKKTYYVTEKGTDINIAAQVLTKAFHNSYDTAIIVSGDTDYLPVYDILNTIGKTVIVVVVNGQNINTLKRHTDQQVFLDLDFLESCKSTYSK